MTQMAANIGETRPVRKKKYRNGWIRCMTKARRFDVIAKWLGEEIYKICPFYTKHGYDRILFGTCAEGIQHKHYLGWNVYDTLPEANISVKEMKARIKDSRVQKKLKRIHRLSQKYLIKPMMNIMFEKGNEMFQSQMNQYLNLNKLDGPDHKGWVTFELFARLRAQGIMEKRKSGNNVFHIKTKISMDYRPALFQMPTRLGLSGGEKATLQILEKLVKTETFFKGDEWKIRIQHINPFKHGFPGWMKYDFALWKNDVLWGLIEFDGKQHYEPVQLFGGEPQFREQQEKDRIKDADTLKLCNGKKCLRMGPNYKGAFAQDRIKAQIVDWL